MSAEDPSEPTSHEHHTLPYMRGDTLGLFARIWLWLEIFFSIFAVCFMTSMFSRFASWIGWTVIDLLLGAVIVAVLAQFPKKWVRRLAYRAAVWALWISTAMFMTAMLILISVIWLN